MANGRKEGRARRATRLEWLVGTLGALMTLATIGYLGWEGLTEPEQAAPALVVEVDSIARRATSWVVEVRARNTGRATAAAVRVVGELHAGDTVVETSDVVLDYVPERSERRGALIFTRDPARYRLELRPAGYARP